MSFTIRPLVWVLDHGAWKACTPAGWYYVVNTVDGWKWYCDLPGFRGGLSDSMEHGKALSEADWHMHIMPALEPVEDGELVEAAKKALWEMRHTNAPRGSFTDAVDILSEALARHKAGKGGGA